jgi:hypothetical protein
MTQQRQQDQQQQAAALAAAQQTLSSTLASGKQAASQAIAQADQTYIDGLTDRLASASSTVATGQGQLTSGFQSADDQVQAQHSSALTQATASIDSANQSLTVQRLTARSSSMDRINSADQAMATATTAATDALNSTLAATETGFENAVDAANNTLNSATTGYASGLSTAMNTATAQRDAQLAQLPSGYATNFSGDLIYQSDMTNANDALNAAITALLANAKDQSDSAVAAFDNASQGEATAMQGAENQAQTDLTNRLNAADATESSSVQAAQAGYDSQAAQAESVYENAVQAAQEQATNDINAKEDSLDGTINQNTDDFEAAARSALQTYASWVIETFGTSDSYNSATGQMTAGTLGSFQTEVAQDGSQAYNDLKDAVEAERQAFIDADTAQVTAITAAETAYLTTYEELEQGIQQAQTEASNELTTARQNAQSTYDAAVTAIWAQSSGTSMTMEEAMAWSQAQNAKVDAAKRVYFSTVGQAEITATQTVGNLMVSAVGEERSARALLTESITKAEDKWEESRSKAQVTLQNATDTIIGTFMKDAAALEATDDTAAENKLTALETQIANAQKSALQQDQSAVAEFENTVADDMEQEVDGEAAAESDYEHTLEDDAQAAAQQMAAADRTWLMSEASAEASWMASESAASIGYDSALDSALQALNSAESTVQSAGFATLATAMSSWQSSADAAWKAAFTRANGTSANTTAIADILVQFADTMNTTSQTAMTEFEGAYQTYISSVFGAAMAANQAESAAIDQATDAISAAITSDLTETAQAVHDQEIAEADAEHSADSAVTDAISQQTESNAAAADTAAHQMIGAASAFGSTVVTTAFQTLIDTWNDQAGALGAEESAASTGAKSLISAAAAFLTANNNAATAAIIAENQRTEDEQKAILDADVGLATAGAKARLADTLKWMKDSLQQLLQSDDNTMNQYSPDQMSSVLGGLMMVMSLSDFTASTAPEQLVPPPNSTPEQIEEIQNAQMILSGAAATAQALRNYGVQTNAMDMMLGGQSYYETAAWSTASQEESKLRDLVNSKSDAELQQSTPAPTTPPIPPMPTPQPPTETLQQVLDKAAALCQIIHNLKRQQLNASIANNTGMVTYLQNQLATNTQLLSVELAKLGESDQLDQLTSGANTVNDLIPGAQLIDGQWQYSRSQINALINSGQGEDEFSPVGGVLMRAAVIPFTDRAQKGNLILKYVPAGYLWGGDYFAVVGVDWSEGDSRTVAYRGVFNPATNEQMQSINSMLVRVGGTLQLAGAVVEGTVGIAASGPTFGVSVILTLHAADQGWAGLNSIITGESQDTFTYTATKVHAMNAGMSENTAGWLAFGLDTGISLGADLGGAGKALLARKVGGLADDAGEALLRSSDDIVQAGMQPLLKIIQETCFVAGTPLLTPEGPRPINELKPGDAILSRSELDPTGDVVVRRVEKIFELTGLIAELTVGGRLIETTAEHPFFVPGKGWRRTHELEPGDLLVGHEGHLTAVDSVVLTERIESVYNLRVETDHTYFVGGEDWGFSIWAHNAYSVRQLPDGSWGVFDGLKNDFIKDGGRVIAYPNEAAAAVAADAGNSLRAANAQNFAFGQYLNNLVGSPPPSMTNPHAHHILFKKGLGPAQQALVDEGQAILRKHGIDPIFGPENLVWAPNVAGQHTLDSLDEVVRLLREVDLAGGGYDEIDAALKSLGRIAANR